MYQPSHWRSVPATPLSQGTVGRGIDPACWGDHPQGGRSLYKLTYVLGVEAQGGSEHSHICRRSQGWESHDVFHTKAPALLGWLMPESLGVHGHRHPQCWDSWDDVCKGVFSSFTEMIWFRASSARLGWYCSCFFLVLMHWFLNQVFITNSSSWVAEISPAIVTHHGHMVFFKCIFQYCKLLWTTSCMVPVSRLWLFWSTLHGRFMQEALIFHTNTSHKASMLPSHPTAKTRGWTPDFT